MSKSRSTPSRCPHCGHYNVSWMWSGGDDVTCGYCLSIVPLEVKEMVYCPVCQCEVETYNKAPNPPDVKFCCDCHNPIGEPLPGSPPDGTILQFSKEGVVGAMGWICPVCGNGVSPLVTVCPCKVVAAKPETADMYRYPGPTYPHGTTDGT